MRLHPILGTLLLVGACGGPTYPVTLTASPSTSAADAIDCVRSQFRKLGYQQTAYDESDFLVMARKNDDTVHRADPQYRRNIDRLEVRAAPTADGKTSLTVTGRTFAELETHRGPTEEEQPASSGVKESSQAILDACGR